MHGGVFMVMWMEMIVNHIKFRKSDIWYVLLFSFGYGILNFLYTFLKEPVYSTLDWKSVTSYFNAIGATIVSAIHFWIGYYYCKKVKVTDNESIYNSNNSYQIDNSSSLLRIQIK